MQHQTKPWWAEREFLFAMGAVIGGIALIIQGDKVTGVGLITGGVASFNISRGIAKTGQAKPKEIIKP